MRTRRSGERKAAQVRQFVREKGGLGDNCLRGFYADAERRWGVCHRSWLAGELSGIAVGFLRGGGQSFFTALLPLPRTR
jgi:hypothetical protein